ncbi:MAG TPA: DUF1570 domain-containing protein [Tepidisphaeraceae bacterium]|nr:DUF1570 domain-containing protein [Tepidisphaeraceae bacterium]
MVHLSPVLFAAICLLTAQQAVSAGELRTLRSAHYLVHTDLEPSLAEDLATRLDAMHDEYARRLGALGGGGSHARASEKFEVYLFARRADYMRLTQNRYPNTGGIFMSQRNVLAAYLEGQGRDGLRRAIQHEAFHQFAFTAIGPHLPTWLNEGMAQYFEEGIWTGTQFTFGQVPPRRLRQLQHDMRQRQIVPFTTMLATTHEQWEKILTTDAERGATHYNQAWAMTHFLIHGANGTVPYRPRLIDMLKRIHAGVHPQAAFTDSFSPNIDGFQARFEEFASQLTATPEATMIERQTVLADLLVESHRIGRRYGDVREFREDKIGSKARLRYNKGQLKWQTSPDVRIYFADLDNRVFEGNELYFDHRGAGPLPDLVCRASQTLRLRTRFHDTGERIEHEVLCEPPSSR